MVLALAIILGSLPFNAMAADPIADKYVIDGVTYYATDSPYFKESTKLFLEDMLAKKNSTYLEDSSVAALWQYLAFRIQDEIGSGTNYSPTGTHKKNMDAIIPKKGLAYSYETNTTGDVLNSFRGNFSQGDHTYNVRRSKLTYASSVNDAKSAMENELYSWYRVLGSRKNKYGSDDNAVVRENLTLKADTKDNHSYWMLTGALKSTSGQTCQGHYQAMGILFSDFSITTILPEDNGDFQEAIEEESGPGKIYASNVKNNTDLQVGAAQELTYTTSTSASSEISGSESYSFEESIELGAEGGFLGTSVSSTVGFTAGQIIEKGWSETSEHSEEVSSSYNMSVELPAYTNVMIQQNNSKTTKTKEYNCPVALNFKVTIVEYTLDPSASSSIPQTRILTTFGGNARKDLRQRGVTEYTMVDSAGIDWYKLYSNHNYDLSNLFAIVEKQLTSTVPMASTGASFTIGIDTVTSEISGLAPIYALNSIKPSNGITEYNIGSGNSMILDSIELAGLNAKNAPYYGFNQDKGEWILVDENGQELSNDDVAYLETNPMTGTTKLIAGHEGGTVYLKYLIDEDVYSTASSTKVYTANNELESTAVIQINVIALPADISAIEIGGDLTGIVGDLARTIEGSNGLTAYVYNSLDKEVNYPIEWEAKELAHRGIEVEDNKIFFTKEGTFHVRAIVEGFYSDWYPVTALPARKLAEIKIPDAITLKYNVRTLDLNKLEVSFNDQYGSKWEPEPTLTWTCTGEGVSIDENNILSLPSGGTYTVTASAEGVISNDFVITAEHPEEYALTFDANGGIGEMESKLAIQGKPFKLPTNIFTAPEGQFFKEWLIESEDRIETANEGDYYTFTSHAKISPVWENIPVTGISLDKDLVRLAVSSYKTETLIARVEPEDAANKTVKWLTSAPDIVDVDENGKLTSVGPGTATITAKTDDGEKTASCTVVVTSRPVRVSRVSFDKANLTLSVGQSEKLVAEIIPDNATNQSLTWSSTRSTVAAVDENGKVTAIAPGLTNIIATSKDGKKRVICRLTVEKAQGPVAVTGISLDKASTILAVGKIETLNANIEPFNASNKEIEWKTSNSEVASVDNNGKVTAKYPGIATITATTLDGGRIAECIVKVQQAPTNVPVEAISLNKTSMTLARGNKERLVATITPDNASNKDLIWTSSNPLVVTVNENGEVAANRIGSATITVKSKDTGKEATCLVRVINQRNIVLDFRKLFGNRY